MSYFDAPLAFPLGGNVEVGTACWDGDLSSFEETLLLPRQDYVLEQLRARFLALVTTSSPAKMAARATLQMAMETELRAVLAKLIDVAPDVEAANVCPRRRFLEVDTDMRTHHYLVSPAFAALAKLPNLPTPYVDMVRRYGRSAYPRYRMSALAATVCLAAAVGA